MLCVQLDMGFIPDLRCLKIAIGVMRSDSDMKLPLFVQTCTPSQHEIDAGDVEELQKGAQDCKKAFAINAGYRSRSRDGL